MAKRFVYIITLILLSINILLAGKSKIDLLKENSVSSNDQSIKDLDDVIDENLDFDNLLEKHSDFDNDSNQDELEDLNSQMSEILLLENPSDIYELTMDTIKMICDKSSVPVMLDEDQNIFTLNKDTWSGIQRVNNNFEHIKLNGIEDKNEFLYEDIANNNFYMIKKYPQNKIKQFHNELKAVYRLRPSDYDTYGAITYDKCFYDDRDLYIVFKDQEKFTQLYSKEVLTKIASFNNPSALKKLYTNLAKLLIYVHGKAVTSGSFTIDNVLVNDSFTKFRLKNFEFAVCVFEIEEDNKVMSEQLGLREQDVLSKYYKDAFDLIIIYMFFDKNIRSSAEHIYNLLFKHYLGDKPIFTDNEFIKSLLPSSSKTQIEKAIDLLTIQSIKPKNKKKEEFNLLKVFSSFFKNCTYKDNEDCQKHDFNFKFNPLQLTYNRLLNLGSQDLNAAKVLTEIHEIDASNFITWLNRYLISDSIGNLEKDQNPFTSVTNGKKIVFNDSITSGDRQFLNLI